MTWKIKTTSKIKKGIKNQKDLKNENDLKNKDDPKHWDDIKNQLNILKEGLIIFLLGFREWVSAFFDQIKGVFTVVTFFGGFMSCSEILWKG